MAKSNVVSEYGEITQFFRNCMLFLGGGGSRRAFKCLKEVMEKSTSRSLTICRSMLSVC